MRLRRLAEAVLMLAACLLLDCERLYGQREIIATSVPVTPQTPAVSAPPRPPPPRVPSPPPQTIQQVSYVEASQEPPTPMMPPKALLSGMTTGGTPLPTMQTGGTPVPPMPVGPATRRSIDPPPQTGGTPLLPAMLSVEVVGPNRLLLGQALVHEIVLRNKGGQPIAELHVEQPLPPASRVLKADPPALVHSNRLAWDLRHLEAGGERRLKIELDPGRPGELDVRPYVSFLTGHGLRTQVIRPPFSIDMSADKTKATRGERIRFRLELANHGDAPVRNIKIYDTLPEGLYHSSGTKIIGVEHFGDLLPGETRSIPLETTAVASGPFHNEVVAQADRGVEAKAAIDGVILEPSLSLRLDGPTQTVTHREMDFSIEVANPAVLTAKNVHLVQALPPAFEVVSASSGASLDAGRHALVWSLPELGSDQRQRVTFRIKVNAAGDWPMSAIVQSQNFPEAHVNNSLHADAAAVLKLDVHVHQERLSVGDETVFRLHIFNKGDAPCAGVQLSAVLPEALALVEAKGPSDVQVEKQQIRFAPLTHLDGYGDAVYLLRVLGRQVGQGSLRVALTGEKQTPAAREISIQVHENATATGQANSNASEALR